MDKSSILKKLGWQAFFQQQINLNEFEHSVIARVTAHHRSGYEIITLQGSLQLILNPSLPQMTVGDWLLLDSNNKFVRLLSRKSLFKRKAPGNQVSEQLIAANVDTLIIVFSLNHDFNLNRIERYLALAHEAGSEPFLILTKMDLCPDVEAYLREVRQVDPMLLVEVVNALDSSCIDTLQQCFTSGRTFALVGSSGVGKSTLVNTLTGNAEQKTGAIRDDDSKGRHTTSARSVHFIPNGSVLIDTPGMRELQLTYCNEGLRLTFTDIHELSKNCRFKDCQHVAEPGCAVLQAIEDGSLDYRRLTNFHKLKAEQIRNAASLQERRAQDRQFSKMVQSGKSLKTKKYDN
ncbi:ribosome small subunit-dependent GTPase A [Vibrio cholerae]|uniref:ribosome small subunit-dependent GTPase A n=1 Tax=Vibrio cholerae TaxID=666 RepID=UPI00053C51A7|nr:ribosome small subunit-dependent GTPase A [Vibrio cholerae]